MITRYKFEKMAEEKIKKGNDDDKFISIIDDLIEELCDKLYSGEKIFIHMSEIGLIPNNIIEDYKNEGFNIELEVRRSCVRIEHCYVFSYKKLEPTRRFNTFYDSWNTIGFASTW